MWVPQWPLPSEKLQAVKDLVAEQLQLGHIEPSTSPWNTPIFAIKKKSGKWRLLHDLRAINAQMNLFGPVQRGLPLLSALPSDWHVFIIDIKDCFFSIPLCSMDRPRFAFTIPSINHRDPDSRYQWKVLPQGMANSPTMCQLYVQQALQPIREQFSELYIIHYMDDILLSHGSIDILQEAFLALQKSLAQWNLQISPEKVQYSSPGDFLGTVVLPRTIQPQRVSLQTKDLKTLNDFQKLLGDINWLRPFLKIPSADLIPLFKILEGDTNLSSPRQLTPAARKALQQVESAISSAQLLRVDYQEPWQLCIFPTKTLPTAALWQKGPLLWIHPHASPSRSILWYPSAVAELALRGLRASLEHFGHYPATLVIPYTAHQFQVLATVDDSWAVVATSFSGKIDNHFPKHPLAQFASMHPLIFPRITSATPIRDGITAYTDGSKTGIGAYVIEGRTVQRNYGPSSPQVVECKVVLEVLKTYEEPLNIVSDSIYVVNALQILETAGLIKESSTVATLFKEIQQCLLQRKSPFFITHIRAHSNLPGPMALGNALADAATRMAMLAYSALQEAQDFHAKFHVTAETLRRRFRLTRQQAREIVVNCKNCCQFLPVRHVGINPRGIKPLQLWQMDVTHVPSFGKSQYVHVSVDTCSNVIIATPLTGEKSIHVIQHCLEAWSAWGKPQILKTDNGPAYTSQKFQQFCAQMQVSNLTGLPYNPQGQGIVERAHRTLKAYLIKQKGGIENTSGSPRSVIALTLFTLNFLNLDDDGRSAADRHLQIDMNQKEMVKWKDVLNNQWKGPDPILIRSRGAVCVFPQDAAQPHWVPERLTRKILEQSPAEAGPSEEPEENPVGENADLVVGPDAPAGF